jgi:hypothetical protein
LCKKIVAFFTLLSKTQETGVRKLGVTQELLALVTGLAHYLKLLIRICLQGALKVEREQNDASCLNEFLTDLSDMEAIRTDDRSLEATTGIPGLSSANSDYCSNCRRSIEDECACCDERRWHLVCSALIAHENLAIILKTPGGVRRTSEYPATTARVEYSNPSVDSCMLPGCSSTSFC